MDKKILASIIAGVVVVGIIFAVTNYTEPENTPKNLVIDEKVGLVINTPTNSVTLEDLDKIYSKAARTGIGRSNVYLFWNIIEPEKDQYNWTQSDILMSFNKKNNLKTTLYFSVINGETLGPFPQWIGKPPIQSIQEDRLVSVLDAILSRYDIIDTVIISGQTESQFRYGKQNIPAYKELFNEVYTQLKEKHPDVKIGNSFALHHVLNKNLENIVTELSLGDFVAFSYLPVNSLNDIVKTPDQSKQDLETIFELVPDKKIALFEMSWSTSEYVGGNQESQKEFIKESFDFYSEHKSEIEFFTWYRLYDRPIGTCVNESADLGEKKIEVGGESGLGSSEFVIERLDNYLCNAGLYETNGSPKLAWNELKNQMQNLN